MGINFHPKPGMVLLCDFHGYIAPEIIKRRPVVVISPAHLRRTGLIAVVPLSTTAPSPIEPYHYLLRGNPVPGSTAEQTWAKCDLVASVSVERLDRFKIGRGLYDCGRISSEQVWAIKCCVAMSLGVDIKQPKS